MRTFKKLVQLAAISSILIGCTTTGRHSYGSSYETSQYNQGPSFADLMQGLAQVTKQDTPTFYGAAPKRENAPQSTQYYAPYQQPPSIYDLYNPQGRGSGR